MEFSAVKSDTAVQSETSGPANPQRLRRTPSLKCALAQDGTPFGADELPPPSTETELSARGQRDQRSSDKPRACVAMMLPSAS